MLGRYEMVNPDTNTDKFWSCTYDKKNNLYTTSWGRNGTAGQYKFCLTEDEAYKKINEKISKGYVKVAVAGQTTAIPLIRKPKGESKPRRPRAKKDEFDFMDELRKIK